MNLGEVIKWHRKKAKMSREKLGAELGVSFMTVRRWEVNERTPDVEQIKKIAEILDAPMNELLGVGTEKLQIQNIRPVRGGVIEVPVLGPQCTACCGEGFNLTDIDADILRYELVPEEWLHGPKGDKPPYILQVAGDSMEPLIDDGERILVNPNLDPAHGRIVVACWNDYTMVRAVHFERNGDIRLRARNAAYQDVLITAKDAPEVLRFGGVVTEFLGRARPATGFF